MVSVMPNWEGDLTYPWDGNKINDLFAIVDGYDRTYRRLLWIALPGYKGHTQLGRSG